MTSRPPARPVRSAREGIVALSIGVVVAVTAMHAFDVHTTPLPTDRALAATASPVPAPPTGQHAGAGDSSGHGGGSHQSHDQGHDHGHGHAHEHDGASSHGTGCASVVVDAQPSGPSAAPSGPVGRCESTSSPLAAPTPEPPVPRSSLG